MSKRLHLICNAHLDPVWQWEWEEGAAEALSTFRIAADFCEEYDSFVFCHNEALLYEWIEEYDKPLFEHIRALVKKRQMAHHGWLAFAAGLQYAVGRRLCAPNSVRP